MNEKPPSWFGIIRTLLQHYMARLAIHLCGVSMLYYAAPEVWEAYMSEGNTVACNRCGASIPDGEEEVCWYCDASLCYDCWDEHGHCGHAEAEAQNERMRQQIKNIESRPSVECPMSYEEWRGD